MLDYPQIKSILKTNTVGIAGAGGLEIGRASCRERV